MLGHCCWYSWLQCIWEAGWHFAHSYFTFWLAWWSLKRGEKGCTYDATETNWFKLHTCLRGLSWSMAYMSLLFPLPLPETNLLNIPLWVWHRWWHILQLGRGKGKTLNTRINVCWLWHWHGTLHFHGQFPMADDCTANNTTDIKTNPGKGIMVLWWSKIFG